MKIETTSIPGCYTITLPIHFDSRGHFVKWFSCEKFNEFGLTSKWAEVYGSVSHRGVIRGLHFQKPPCEHAKLVYCLGGSALDVVLDLRLGSRSYGEHVRIELSSEKAVAVYIPAGCAHGFLAQADKTFMFYQVSSCHAPALDAGIRWDSAGIEWPTTSPIVSRRDRTLTRFADFVSPFC
jgi:dTDP-4-dehydrorhamnose 3,5-epimerase